MMNYYYLKKQKCEFELRGKCEITNTLCVDGDCRYCVFAHAQILHDLEDGIKE